jgi:hypothetical protein
MEDEIFAGTKPSGNARWGQADVGGNVWEMVLATADGHTPRV